MSILILVDATHADGHLEITARLIGAARALPGPITLFVIGEPEDPGIAPLARLEGVNAVRMVALEINGAVNAEELTERLVTLAAAFTHILAPANRFGAEILPRLGGRLGITPVTGVVEIDADGSLVRAMHAGNVLARVTTTAHPVLLTAHPWAFAAVGVGERAAPVEPEPKLMAMKGSTALGLTKAVRPEGMPGLSSARIVVAGGAGLEKGGDFAPVEELAKALGGAVGASRGAVDAGLAPAELQIGQTGLVLAPELYIGLGISGAVQHLAGIKDAGCIVSINIDPSAPLAAMADLALTADAREAVAAFIKTLSKLS
ncbi:MAG: electron transfer flavoprotein subunit alpha/FixB family protein [Magnetococcus sp. YQC-9]